LNVENASELPRVDAVLSDVLAPEGVSWAQVYAIDPTSTNFTSGVVEVTAKGTSLYKCKDWNFDARECDGEWLLVAEDMVPGNSYLLELTPDDPGFGEVIVTKQPGSEGKDTHIISTSSNYNYGADTGMDIRADDARRILIEFNLSGVPSGANISSATLQLYATAKGTANPVVNIYRLNRSWVEGTGAGSITNDGATWNKYDGVNSWNVSGGEFDSSKVWANTTVTAINAWYSWNVKDLVQSWVNGSYQNYGMLIRTTTTSSATTSFVSSDNTNASIRPKLVINYSEGVAPQISLVQSKSVIKENEAFRISVNATDNNAVNRVLVALAGTNYSLAQSSSNSSNKIVVVPAIEGSLETGGVDSYKNSYDRDNSSYSLVRYDTKKLLVRTPGISDIGIVNSVKVNVVHSGTNGITGSVHWAMPSVQGSAHDFSVNSSVKLSTFDVTSERSWSLADFNSAEIHVNRSSDVLKVHEVWFEVNYIVVSSGDIWSAVINTSGLTGLQRYTIYANDSSGNSVSTEGNVSIEKTSVLLNASMNDASGSLTPVQLEIYDADNNLEFGSDNNESSTFASVEPGNKTVRIISASGPVEEMNFTDLSVVNSADLKIGYDTPENVSIPGSIGSSWAEVFALNPPGLNFSVGKITITATGNKLYKCGSWNFTSRACPGNWSLLRDDLVPGREYTIEVTASDPAFGEILATAAEHLDENYTFVSDIFSQISTIDSVWSESIPANHSVRVTFEHQLTNGSVIDFLARDNGTVSYVEVYIANTSYYVGRSGVCNPVELQYISLENLPYEADTFDLKVVKLIKNITNDDCPAEEPECHNNLIAENALSGFLEFDFIHDSAITPSGADGLAPYSESGVAAPRYRLWNKTTTSFSAELTNSIAPTTDSAWIVAHANQKFNQHIMGILDDNQDTSVQVWNNTNWTSFQSLAATQVNTDQRSFDIAISSLSGNGLIVYENDTVANSIVAYNTWNGTNWSSASALNYGQSSPARWVKTVAKPNSNEIMVLIQTTANNLTGILWNGTAFVSSSLFNISNTLNIVTGQVFDFEWMTNSTNGIVVYANTTGIYAYRIFNSTSKTFGTDAVFFTLPATAPRGVRLCSDPTSNRVGFVSDGTGTADFMIWNGTAVETSPTPPARDTAITANSGAGVNLDCAFEKQSGEGVFIYIDGGGGQDSGFRTCTYNRTNWSAATMATCTYSGDLTLGRIRNDELNNNPVTDEIMGLIQDDGDDLVFTRWNSSNWTNTTLVETTLNCVAGATQCAMYSWDQYDPPPSISIVVPLNNSNFSQSAQVNITANASDNLGVSLVNVSIASPNGTVYSYNMALFSGTSLLGLYQLLFNATSQNGRYNFTVQATDTGSQTAAATGYFNVVITNFTNVSVTKTDSPDPVLKGSQLNYTINVTNSGTATATNVTVMDGYASGVAFNNSSPVPSAGNNTWSLGNLSAGQSVLINITVNVSSALANGSSLNNTANVTFTNTSGTFT
ncbi:MAG: DNRLRE domain-containing protein, partial [Candidatus Woesearchaeota archaeon]|nr:DNRLRE domain-containing protein [Candidatus Woesearchaeota archaeon]